MTAQVLKRIRETVSKVRIEKKGTIAGDVQRETFRIRCGKKPDEI